MRLIAPIALALSFACASSTASGPAAATSTGALASSEGLVPVEEAGRYQGRKVSVEFTIVQVGGSKGSTFLNSKPHTPQSEDFVAYIPSASKQAFTAQFGEDLRAALQGKKVRVTGEVVIFKGQPEIVLKSADQLQLIP